MKKIMIIFPFVMVIASMVGLTACSQNDKSEASSQQESKAVSSKAAITEKPIGYQLEAPAAGEDVAVLTTSMGTIKLRLFPDAAPKAVENFKGLINKGYYNGLTFHRVIKDFMVQSGDPTGNGKGGTSLWNKPFEDEFNSNLLNIRGAMAMANSGNNTNGSQFFINQATASSFSGWDNFEQAYSLYKKDPDGFVNQYGSSWIDMSKVTPEYKKIYEKNGGNPHLDGAYNIVQQGHTVFAQVYDGMDVVDKIAAVKVDSSYKPVDSVTITKAEIQKYKG